MDTLIYKLGQLDLSDVLTLRIEYFLLLSLFMLACGVYGFIARKNTLAMLISVELMLNAADINFAVFNRYLFPEQEGLVFALFGIAIAAAETAVAIAIMINIYRNLTNIQTSAIEDLKH